MSFILDHRQKIVDSCHPESREEATRLWHDIKGVKFGNIREFEAVAPAQYEFAAYQIPEDASYMLIMRVECYTVSFVAAAPDFGLFGPPPSGFAFWEYTDVSLTFGTEYRITPRIPIHLLCDTEELLLAKGGNRVSLSADGVPNNPDANARFIRTLVYAYLISPLIADKLGVAEETYFGSVVT